ncbi:MAG: T9SS type A sorting domain-containing protein [Lewinellaceae bacterium]|nr:T9SS type A sorting domain-containing protein [Lewinellaceae bacterium]
MKNALTLLICLLHLYLFSFAQPSAVTTIKSFDEKGPWPGRGYTVERPPGSPAYSEYDAYGDPPQWEWVQKMGGDGLDQANGFVEAADGDLYITGSFSGEITLGGDSYTSQGYEDMFVAKINNAGSVLWMKQFPAGEREQLVGRSIDLGENGNLYLTGHFTGGTMAFGTPLSTDKPRAAFLARLDGDGNTLWAMEYDYYFAEQRGNKVKVLDSGELLLLTQYSGNSTLGFLSKFNASGQAIWEYPDNPIFKDFDVKGSSLFFTGDINTTASFGDIVLDAGDSYGRAFIAKAGLDLTYEWAVVVEAMESGESFPEAIIASEDGCYISGYYRGINLFGDVVAPGTAGFYISKLDGSGNFAWASFGEDIRGASLPRLALDGQANVVAIGRLPFSITLGDGTAISSNKESYWLTLEEATGAYLHAEAIDGEAYAIGTTTSGKVIKAGGLFGDLDLRQFDPTEPSVEWSLQSQGPSGWASAFLEGRLGIDASGDAVFIGTFQYEFPTGDISLFSRHTAGFILKTDESGAVRWANSLSADGGQVLIESGATGSDGAVVVAGNFSGIISTAIGDFTGDNSAFIARYDADGNLLSLFTYSATEPVYAVNIDVDNMGNVLASGRYKGSITIGGQSLQSIDEIDIYLAKFTPGLDLVWVQSIGGESIEYSGIPAADEAGNIYFVVETYSADFNIGSINLSLGEGDGNIVLVQFTPEGEALWAKVFGGGDPTEFLDYDCWPVAMEADGAGHVYMAGFIGADNDFGGVRLVNPYWDGASITHRLNWFVSKLDADGNVLWATNVNNRTWAYSSFQMDYDEEGNLYLGGEFRDSVYFLDGALAISPEERLQRYGLLAKFDTTGTLEWLKTVEGANVRVEAVAVAQEDQLIIGGDFSRRAAFDEGNALQNYSSNVFLASTGGLATGLKYLDPAYFSLEVSPNPFYSHFQVSLRLEEAQTVRPALFDTQGRMVQAFAPVTLPGNGVQTLSLAPLASLPRGMYFLQVKVGGIVTVKKVEKM